MVIAQGLLDVEPCYVPMRYEDLNEVVVAEMSLYEFPWTRGNFSDSLEAGYSAWVCRKRRELVSYAVMMQVVDEMHLLNISVCKPWQRCGQGRALLTYLFGLARRHDAVKMLLEVRPSNQAALSLYASFGFAQIGVRRGYYPARDGVEDAWVLMAEL